MLRDEWRPWEISSRLCPFYDLIAEFRLLIAVVELETCDIAITPACLQALYHFRPQSPHARVSPNNSMGIFEEGDYYSQQDLDSFYTNFTSYIPVSSACE